MKLAETLILDGSLRLSPVEAKLRMEAGGGARQGLRLGMSTFHLPNCGCHV